jgi:hypothetical protein
MSISLSTAGPLDPTKDAVRWEHPDDLLVQKQHALGEIQRFVHESAKLGLWTRARMMVKLFRLAMKGNEALSRAVMELPDQFNGFNAFELSQWIEWAQACGIPHIPAEEGPEVSISDLELAFEALGARDPDQFPAVIEESVLPWIRFNQERGWMWRFEGCATQTLKEISGCIRPEECQNLDRVNIPFTVDSRCLRIAWDAKMTTTRLLARPWVKATFDKGFPVEFRVFRLNEGWAACNYYVQRGLDERFMSVMENAVLATMEFENRARALNLSFPETYTADWILTAERELLFLEAGPPFNPKGAGAHPCCFHPDQVLPGRMLLESEPGAQFHIHPGLAKLVHEVLERDLHPLQVAEAHGVPPMILLSALALKGDPRAQTALKQFSRSHAKVVDGKSL